ncbi:unnamed protein product [Diatraea saccharalis]|uniref:Uncharacterized protein n=1 Tax=Diatraea saccharalis TaxID=40085 RepID=A0A9N9R610_9NEOP|nr:unnamed protein product [Diatraea saccharalis]
MELHGTKTSLKLKIAATLIVLHFAHTQSAKTNARPVHEIINEQARSDDKTRHNNAPGVLPYGNPLAGNSQQNARLHAQNQQAMFNAERIRQHRAQVQRWTKAPLPVDSYMKAYHESQESHQMAVEQQQASIRDKKAPNPTTKPPKTRIRQSTLKRGVRIIPEATKEGSVKDKNRNHRSHGSVDYRQYLEPKMYKTVYVSPAPTYDQGVTIKPNGNIGLTSLKSSDEDVKLFTEAIPSKTRYVYPKQYNQMQIYESAKDIEALNALLKKAPQIQAAELNSLVNPENTESKDILDTPIDLYFYMKDPPVQNLASHYDQTYAQIPPTYASSYMPSLVKDYTPITEEVDDIENPDKDPKVKPYGLQSVLATQKPEIETTSKKSNNYYKVEVASQTINAGYNPSEVNHLNDIGSYKIQAQPLIHYLKNHPTSEGDLSERYLHHNAQHHGIQHLSEDGTETSAYGDESVSINNNNESKHRNKRAIKEPSNSIPETTGQITEIPVTIEKKETPKSEPLIRINPLINNHKKEIETFLTTPNFPVGVAIDYNTDYESDVSISVPKKRLNRGQYDYSIDDDEFNDYSEDFNTPDYEYSGTQNFKQPSLFRDGHRQNYASNLGYNQNTDLTTSFSNKFRNIKRYPNLSNRDFYDSHNGYNYGPPATSYGVPNVYGHPGHQYGLPQRYGVPNVIEPVYMLTENQLKSLLHYAANYEFGYRVRDHESGNDFGHHEAKSGEKTNGHYHVRLPDGRMQKVRYSAGPEGFHADISYDHLK